MPREIFRQQAVQRYNTRIEQTVLPRQATAPWILIWWISGGCLLLATVAIWAVRTPHYVTGPAVVVAPPADLAVENAAVVAVFLPAATTPKPAPAQRVQLTLPMLPHSEQTVAGVTAHALSPHEARIRYGLDDSTGLLIKEPVLVALVVLQEEATPWLGSVGEAQIEVGMQSGLALLPGLGTWSTDDPSEW